MKKWIVLLLMLMVPFSVSAELGVLDKMVMPGKLIKGHEKIEDECSNCHVMFNKKAQDKTCMACHAHRNIEQDVLKGLGYHGRLKDKGCRKCHTDHKGRDAKIIRLDKNKFDHGNTDYALLHLHKKVKCGKCHQGNKKYSEAPSACYTCHRKDDKHKGGLGKKCADCHSEKGWKKTSFDHSKTEFELGGAHKKAKCQSCHKNNKFKKTPKECNACHRKDDVHKGKLGVECQNCHNDVDWKKTRFDHSKTEFPLQGAHSKVKCKLCHKTKQYKGAPKDCYSCHRKDDKHKGGLGRECQNCHYVTNWKKVRFDHDKTGFALRGKHKPVKCTACHKRNRYKDTPDDCYSCHRKDDEHRGQLGRKCESCHNEYDWEKTEFEHDLTSFPLLAKHAEAGCKDCHRTGKYKDAPEDCYSCHKKEDEHKRRLGTECQQCHNPRGWKYWRFNHAKQTGFKLDGGHKNIECLACHREKMTNKVLLSALCVTCHEKDDVHDGGFGTQCERCHITDNFTFIRSQGRRIH